MANANIALGDGAVWIKWQWLRAGRCILNDFVIDDNEWKFFALYSDSECPITLSFSIVLM